MINVTEKAQKQVKAYFEGKVVQPIRIFVNHGCGGAQLAMALDEKKETDRSFTYGGGDYIMETRLLEEARLVEVDFVGTGFTFKSSLELGGGICSSCGQGGSCCD